MGKLAKWVAAAVVCSGFLAEAATHRVVANEADRQGDWAGASTDLKGTVEGAAQGDTILVGAGTYVLSSEIEIKVAGLTIRSANLETGETDRENTVLDGNGACRILKADSKNNVTIDGFTFRNGKEANGGALWFYICRPFRLLDCIVEDSAASGQGGGLYAFLCDGSVVSNCIVRGNSASGGGGIYTQQNEGADSRITVVACTVSNNTINVAAGGQASGAAIYAARCITVRDTLITGNVANRDGASNYGPILRLGMNLVMEGCTIRETSPGGGGYGTIMYLEGPGATVSNALFEITETASGYGAINFNGADKRFYDCRFTGCSLKGPLLYFLNSSGHLFRNCLFADNDNPAALIGYNGCKTCTYENCTFAHNREGVDAFSCGGANVIVNCISTARIVGNETTFITNSCLPVTSGGVESGVVITSEPGFKQVLRGDFRLRSDSPCVDKAAALGWMEGAKDLDGYARVVGAGPDMGCFEHQAGEMDTSLLVVAKEEDRIGEWATASTDIQGVIDSAIEGDLILVRSGEYALEKEIVVSNKTVILRSRNPLTGELDEAGTVFNGGGKVRGLFLHTGPLKTFDGAWGAVAETDHPALIEGFTFTNCYSAGDGGAVWFRGQGSQNGKPATLRHCTIVGSSADGNGGGLLVHGGGRVEYCTIRGNAAGGGGGGGNHATTSNYSLNVTGWGNVTDDRDWYYPVLIGCEISGNTSGSNGGGFRTFNCALFRDCTFADNFAGGGEGGGAQFSYGGVRVEGCAFARNSCKGTAGYGSAMILPSAGVLITNCTVCANGAAYGCLYAGDGAVTVVNSVFSNNSARALWVNTGLVRQCLVTGNTEGIGSFQGSANPLVVENCTVAGNSGTAVIDNGAKTAASDIRVFNSILWGNGATVALQAPEDGMKSISLHDCDLGADARASEYVVFDNCTKFNPGFRDAAGGDYTLWAGSRARDKAVRLDWMSAAARDLAGNPRLVDRNGIASDAALPDLGCFECQEQTPGMLMFIR